MSISSSSSARRAGFKVNDKTVKDLAAIDMAKIGCRTLYVALPPQAFHFAGTSVAITADNLGNTILLPDANSGDLYTSFRLPAEWVSGGNVVIDIYWKSAAITGNVKFTGELASKATGGTTALEETQTVIQAAQTTAGQINKAQLTFAAADFTAGDLVGLHLKRDGTDVSDTLGADVEFVGAAAEFTGRG